MEQKSPDKSLSKQEKWTQFVAGLSPQTLAQVSGKAQLVTEAEDRSDFQSLISTLDPAVRREIGKEAIRRSDWPAGRKPAWWIFETEDGGWPTIRMFKDFRSACQRLQLCAREERDMSAQGVYGIPFYFSKGKGDDRVVISPTGSAINLHDLKETDVLDTEIEIQADGYLGPPPLAVVSQLPVFDESAGGRKKVKSTALPAAGAEGDEGGDEPPEEEGDGAGVES